MANKLERRKAKAAGRRPGKGNKATKKARQRHPHRRSLSPKKEESDSTTQLREPSASSSRSKGKFISISTLYLLVRRWHSGQRGCRGSLPIGAHPVVRVTNRSG